jgi:hypothetical protein
MGKTLEQFVLRLRKNSGDFPARRWGKWAGL